MIISSESASLAISTIDSWEGLGRVGEEASTGMGSSHVPMVPCRGS